MAKKGGKTKKDSEPIPQKTIEDYFPARISDGSSASSSSNNNTQSRKDRDVEFICITNSINASMHKGTKNTRQKKSAVKKAAPTKGGSISKQSTIKFPMKKPRKPTIVVAMLDSEEA